MIIRSIVAALLLALSCSPSFAQDEEGEQEYPITNIAPLVGPGTRLIYSVDANGITYDFIVTLRDKAGRSFDWEMTAPVNKKGTIIHTAAGLENGIYFYNMFAEGVKKLDKSTTSVWLSRKVFTHFMRSAGKVMTVYPFGSGTEPVQMGTFTGEIPRDIILDGKKVYIASELAKELKESQYDPGVFMPSGDASVAFLPEAGLPIIVYMSLDFTIALKEVVTR